MCSRKFTDEDIALWASYIKTVKPMHSKRSSHLGGSEIKGSIKRKPNQSDNLITQPKLFPSVQKQQLKNIHINGRLDLHGFTQSQAYQKLTQFIILSHAQDKRCVLVITGKGSSHATSWWDENGILRNIVPRWLAEEPIRSKITTYATAKPEHGGAGALYVFLKKQT